MGVRPRHSVFIRYLCMFLAVLLIPAGVLGLSVWHNMKSVLWAEMVATQEAAAQQVAFVLEQYTTGMDALAKQLVRDPEVRAMAALMRRHGATLEKTAGMQKLNAFLTPNPFIQRIMVVNGDVIISNEGLLLEYEERAVWKLLDQAGENRFIYRADIVRDKIYYINKLSVVLDNDLYLVCEIPRTMLLELVNALPHGEQGIAVVLEGNGNPVFSNSGSPEELAEFYHSDAAQWQRVKHRDMDYFLYRQPMHRLDLHMALLVPADIIDSPLEQTLRMLLIYLVLSMALGMGMSLWFSYRNYMPIRNMLRKAWDRGGLRQSGWNSLFAISDAYGKTLEDNLLLRKQMEVHQVYTARHFLTNLLQGRYEDEDTISELARQFNISFQSPHFRVVMVRLQQERNIASSLPLCVDNEQMQEVIGRVFHRDCRYTMLMMEPCCPVAVLNYATGALNDEALAFRANQVLHSLQGLFPAHVTVGVSGEVSSLRDLHIAYSQAENACEYRLLRGYDSVIFASEIQELINDVSLQYLQAFKNGAELEKHLEEGNFGAIEVQVNHLFDDIARSRVSISLARCIYYEIINLVLRTLPYNFVKKLDLSGLIQAGTMDRLRRTVLDIYRRACDELPGREGRGDPAEAATKYVREHCADPALSLEMAAMDLGFSRSYLSRVFAKKLGCSFNNYVNRVRVETACILLAGGDELVARIAEQSGYQDLHTFLRNFKKITGMTPTQYRDQSDGRPAVRQDNVSF